MITLKGTARTPDFTGIIFQLRLHYVVIGKSRGFSEFGHKHENEKYTEIDRISVLLRVSGVSSQRALLQYPDFALGLQLHDLNNKSVHF